MRSYAILIHGFHLQADEWENNVWGDPKNGIYGRAPTGLREALALDARTIFFTTGASKTSDGVLEGEQAFKITKERIMEMPEFAEWGADKTLAWLEERAVLELTTQRTDDELSTCGKIAVSRGADHLVLVSSPTHLPRALKTAITEFSKNDALKSLLHGLSAVPSDVSYAGALAEDVVIIEPPHRGDRPKTRTHQILRSIPEFMRDPEKAELLDSELEALFTRLRDAKA